GIHRRLDPGTGAGAAPHAALLSQRRARQMTRPPLTAQTRACGAALAALLACAAASAASPPAETPGSALTTAAVLAASAPSDWRPLDPQNTLYLELASGRVVIEMAPQFAPHHVANVSALARGHYYDGVAIVRSQDNYVVQWADPTGKKPVGSAARTVPAEF